jgi:uncharacterized protein YheU (UPF0270 family)
LSRDVVEVPYARLAADVLRRVAEEFVTRDGTDYGTTEKTLGDKVTDVRRRLERGEAAVVYDATSDTINIVPKCAPPRDGALAAASGSQFGERTEAIMGDRSPKSKQRDQKQKNATKANDAAAAKSKQDSQSHAPLSQPKGRK